MGNTFADPQLWLEAEYLSRRQKNGAYSLRSFARLLDLPSGRVSQLLSRKRNFTPELGKRIALRLNYDPEKTHELLLCIEKARTPRKKGEPGSQPRKFEQLDMDQFQAIADPLHFALLSFLETDGCKGELAEIASRFGITSVEARAALDRLLRIGLLKKGKDGRLQLAHCAGLTTSHDIQSAALREAHKKVLMEAQAAIDEINVELRDITSMTMAIDPRRLPEAKKRLREFRRSLCEFLETGRRTEVYRLNLQLVPVTKKGKKP